LKNALTVDLEFWHSAELIRRHINRYKFSVSDIIYETTESILDMFNDYGVKATFFILGEVAVKYPELIKDIKKKKHEIASHSFTHRPLYDMTPEDFKKEILNSISVIRKITGDSPLGFRAPSFSLNKQTSWALKILEEFGFKYDSSIFPVRTYLYGMYDAPTQPYLPNISDPSKKDPNSRIIEFPLTVYKIDGIRIPIAGGFYLRLLPLKLVINLYRKLNDSGKLIILYFHPWEMYENLPRVNLPFLDKFVTYYGIKSMKNKIENILTKFEFYPIMDIIDHFYH